MENPKQPETVKWIMINSQAFYELVNEVYTKLLSANKEKESELFIDEKNAMKLLNIRSKTTLQKLRDNGNISFSMISKRKILYDKNSILDFIKSNTKEF